MDCPSVADETRTDVDSYPRPTQRKMLLTGLHVSLVAVNTTEGLFALLEVGESVTMAKLSDCIAWRS